MEYGNRVKVLAVGLAVLAVGLFVREAFKQVTLPQAHKANNAFFADLRSKVAGVPGYRIVKQSNPEPYPTKDEMAATDYDLTAELLLEKEPAGSTEQSVQADMTALAAKLPVMSYDVTVENTPVMPGHPVYPVYLCVHASRYLDNDGTYIQQGSGTPANRTKYISPAEFETGSMVSGQTAVSACADLLK